MFAHLKDDLVEYVMREEYIFFHATILKPLTVFPIHINPVAAYTYSVIFNMNNSQDVYSFLYCVSALSANTICPFYSSRKWNLSWETPVQGV
jgi:hypothetical protein